MPNLMYGGKRTIYLSFIQDFLILFQMNLTMDWDFSPVNYSCYTSKKLIPDPSIPSELFSKVLPPVHRVILQFLVLRFVTFLLKIIKENPFKNFLGSTLNDWTLLCDENCYYF